MDGTTAHPSDDDAGLAAEVRESFLLLAISVGVTAAVTIAAQATVSLLG